MTPDQHLAHLLVLLQPPFTSAWSAHVKRRAAELAAEDPACAHLPAAALAEYQRLKSLAKATSISTEKAA
jgi:hypothetical protein